MSQGGSQPDETSGVPGGPADDYGRPGKAAGPASTELTPPPSPADVGPTARATAQGADPASPTIEGRTIPPKIEIDEALGVQGPLRPGQVIFGRYLAEKLLGEGGMGTVWLVKHLELDTHRALKLIVSGIAFDPQARARFKREARVMARLSHPNAVSVHDAKMAKDAAFIEMEYIRGQSLNKKLTPGVPMPLDFVARILEQLCDVLQEAHNLKIVHRDLKPANLMLVDGRPPGRELLKVLDFGIAKILEGDGEGTDALTHTGSFLGSAPYTSPEQAQGTTIDSRSDIYSVGIILYELLTGQRPFSGPITRLIYDHLYSPPPPFTLRNPGVSLPPEIEHVVQRCLAKNPADRPQSPTELIDEFRRALPASLRGSAASELPTPAPAGPGEAPSLPVTQQSAWSAAPSPPTEDASRVPYQPYPMPPTQVGGQYTPPPQAPAPSPYGSSASWPTVAPPLGPTDWDRPVYPPEKPAPAEAPPRSPTRRMVVLLLMLVALGALAALAYVGFIRKPASLRPPEGYVAEEAADLLDGYPRVLVHQPTEARFLRIEGGEFRMGNYFDKPTREGEEEEEDQPPHGVVLSDYYMKETEVTNAEMEAYFRAKKLGPAEYPPLWKDAVDKIKAAGKEPAKYPAVGIPHDMARQVARWMGGQLPTEAQWEYAARSRGQDFPYAWGKEPNPKAANLDTSGLLGQDLTVEVGKFVKDRTKEGLYDMMGNVREWCRDVWSKYQASEEPVRDPVGPQVADPKPADFIVRGGSYNSWKDKVRTTRPRRNEFPLKNGADVDLGFRVVLEWPPSRPGDASAARPAR